MEIHTVGRVHYMLVEGLGAARSWATSIQGCAGHDGRTSPQDEVSTTVPGTAVPTLSQEFVEDDRSHLRSFLLHPFLLHRGR